MTQRYERVLKKGSRDRTKLLFRSLAVYERQLSHNEAKSAISPPKNNQSNSPESNDKEMRSHAPGFAVDEAANDEDEEDDDELALAALEVLDAIEVFKHGDAPIAQASIPSDNLRKLIMFLLLIAPMDAQESLSKYSERLVGEKLEGLRRTAANVLAAFVNDVEK